MISAVSTTGKLHFTFAQGKVNAEVYIEYLKKLLRDVERPAFLIVDGHPSHNAKKVNEFVACTEGRLELFFRLRYSPQLNPDEWVWKKGEASSCWKDGSAQRRGDARRYRSGGGTDGRLHRDRSRFLPGSRSQLCRRRRFG
jgi:hypothetical protein